MQLEFIVEPEQAGCRLYLFLRRRGLSASLIKSTKYTRPGLSINGHWARTSDAVSAGDRIRVALPPEKDTGLEPEDIPLDILYESPHAMVINKPAGMVMHPAMAHSGGTLGNAFAGLMQKRESPVVFRPIGRLDGNTTGVVLCAMNAYAAPLLAKSMRKGYLALATGSMPVGKGRVDAPLGPKEGSIGEQRVRPDGRPALTEYQVLAATPGASLMAVAPRTGRTHQIRAHMAHLGHPLLGDDLYGGTQARILRHALHCAHLRFTDPETGQTIEQVATLPQDMAQLVTQVGCTWEKAFRALDEVESTLE